MPPEVDGVHRLPCRLAPGGWADCDCTWPLWHASVALLPDGPGARGTPRDASRGDRATPHPVAYRDWPIGAQVEARSVLEHIQAGVGDRARAPRWEGGDVALHLRRPMTADEARAVATAAARRRAEMR